LNAQRSKLCKAPLTSQNIKVQFGRHFDGIDRG
jgi:hypothetical protein